MHERRLIEAIEVSEQISAMKSKEKQKAFCIFAGDCIRKIYVLQHQMCAVAGLKPEESEFLVAAARWFGQSFCERMLAVLDKSSMLLDRNVYAKIVFCDLADRMFINGTQR